MSNKQLGGSDGLAAQNLIRKTPNVLGGEARIGDRRIAVWMLVRARQLGLSDEEIKSHYLPHITDEELAATWSYYEKNRKEIDDAIRKNEED